MHSILFYIGPVPIRAYGLMLWIGLIVGMYWAVRASRRTDIKSEQVLDVVLYSILAGVVGAHLASILLDLPHYLRQPSEIFGLWSGALSPEGGLRGLSFHGGLIGGLGVAYLYTRKKGINFLSMADLCAPGLAIGYGITRIGCFLNGCCHGVPTNLPWAFSFYEGGPPSHPTQLYALIASILIFMALVGIHRNRHFTGQVFMSYLVLYSVYRFLVEFLRKGVTAEVAFAGMTQAQVVSLAIFLIVVPILTVKMKTTELRINKQKEA